MEWFLPRCILTGFISKQCREELTQQGLRGTAFLLAFGINAQLRAAPRSSAAHCRSSAGRGAGTRGRCGTALAAARGARAGRARAAHAEPPQGKERLPSHRRAATAWKCSEQPLNLLWAFCRAQKDLSGMENKDKNQVIECCIIKTWQNFCRVMKVIVSEISETPVLCWLVQDHLCKLAFLTVACPVISLEHFQTHGSLYFYAEWWDKILKTWSRKLVFEWCYVSI